MGYSEKIINHNKCFRTFSSSMHCLAMIWRLACMFLTTSVSSMRLSDDSEHIECNLETSAMATLVERLPGMHKVRSSTSGHAIPTVTKIVLVLAPSIMGTEIGSHG